MLCADEVIGNQGTPGDATFRRMRELAIIITAFVALSAMGRGNGRFVLQPTGPLPAVNVL
jgi:hypothetical protein